jgi:hypothetical protein
MWTKNDSIVAGISLILVIICSITIAYISQNQISEFKKEAISKNVAYYDPKTGDFKFKSCD